jgi:putative dimethyl sulfoxide reductase chaperone
VYGGSCFPAHVLDRHDGFQTDNFRLIYIERTFITLERKKNILIVYTHAIWDYQLYFSSAKGNVINMQSILTDTKKTVCLDVLKILCRIFWGPDIELCQEVMNGKFVKLLQDASDSFRVDLSTAVKAAARLAGEYGNVETLCAVLSDGYVALFVNDIKGTPVPLYHSCYLASDHRLMGPPAMDMRSRLERHGLFISLPGNEPADHLSIELEYLYYLLNKGWSESSSNPIQEAVQFAGDSMAGWVCRFSDLIIVDGRFPFYAIAARLLCAIVQNLSESKDYDETGH